MNIRTAEKYDLAQWQVLRTKLWPQTDDDHKAELENYFNGQSFDIVEAFVLDDGKGNVVGFMELNIRNFAEGSTRDKVPYVEAWYVDDVFQNQGYGKQFMALAEEWAKQKGYNEIASDTEIVNKRSIAIHKKLGYEETERVVCFLKKL